MITRINNFYILEKQAEYLNKELYGFVIKSVNSFEKNRLHIECSHEYKQVMLEFSIENDFTYLVKRDNFFLPSKNIALVMEECTGKIISYVSQVNDDRMISIFFDDNSCLLFNFVNHKQNCFYIKNGKIINAYKNSKDITGVPLNEIFIDKREDTDLLKRELSKFGKDALLNIADINKLKELYSAAKYFLYRAGEKIFASFYELDDKSEYEKSESENINALLLNWIKYRNKEKNFNEAKQEVLSGLSKKLKQSEKNILSFKTQLKNINESHKYKLYGDKIMENIWKIKKGDVLFEAEHETEILPIKLKETLSPQENAKNYYEKYKKQKGSVVLIEKKLADAESHKKKIEEEIKLIKSNEDYKNLKKMAVREEKIRDDETNKFRKFKVADDLEVWVGKDSASNDLLTMHYSAHNDLWFHVRGFSGSHTVLKTGSKKEIDKKYILSAASIAAYYSKARNGGNVPVAYTERKYVKKKKGFREGTVILEKEKVIFVKPGLPESGE